MTNQWDDDQNEDDYDEVDEPRQRNNSNLVNDLRKQLKAKEKLLREQSEKLEALTKTTRTNTIKSFLQDNKVNPKLAKYVPSDIEATEEALTAWVKEDGDLFGIKLGGNAEEENESEEVFEANEIEAIQQMNRTIQNGTVPSGKEADNIAKIMSLASPDELTQFLQSQGMKLNSASAE